MLSLEAWLSRKQPVTTGQHTSPYRKGRAKTRAGAARYQSPVKADLQSCLQVHPLAMCVGGRFPFFLELFLEDVKSGGTLGEICIVSFPPRIAPKTF